MRFEWLRRHAIEVLTASACCLLFLSILSPFLSASINLVPNGWTGYVERVDGKLWSFKETLTSFAGPVTRDSRIRILVVEHWFGDFWGLARPTDDVAYLLELHEADSYGMIVLVYVFIPQTLTLSFVVLSLLARRFSWLWLLEATVSNMITLAGIWLFSRQFIVVHFEAGSLLTVVSAILLATISIASLAWNRRTRLLGFAE